MLSAGICMSPTYMILFRYIMWYIHIYVGDIYAIFHVQLYCLCYNSIWISSKIALDELGEDIKPSCQNKIGQHPGAARIAPNFLFPGFGGKNQGHLKKALMFAILPSLLRGEIHFKASNKFTFRATSSFCELNGHSKFNSYCFVFGNLWITRSHIYL